MDFYRKKESINILHKLEQRSIGISKTRKYNNFCNLNDTLKARFHPHLQASWNQRPLHIGDKNKIFASYWLNSEEVLYGTKCNQLIHLNVDNERECSIPLLNSINSSESISSSISFSEFPENCSPAYLLDQSIHPIIFGNTHTPYIAGIHTIQANSSGTRLATGAANVNNVGVYTLPELDPFCVLENAHFNWVFDVRWIDDAALASCSRDNRLALWNIGQDSDTSMPHHSGKHFSLDPSVVIETPGLRDKVRSMEYVSAKNLLAVLSTNQIVYFYDPVTISESQNQPYAILPLHCEFNETMVVRAWPSQPYCIAVSGQQRIAIYDTRGRISHSNFTHNLKCQINSICGIRSLNFNGPIISYGTSNGYVFFFDLRNQHHILAFKSPTMKTPNYHDWNPYFGLNLPETWLPPTANNDFRPYGRNSAKISAVYTHEYDRFATRLFCGGGPITAQVYGNVACIYE